MTRRVAVVQTATAIAAILFLAASGPARACQGACTSVTSGGLFGASIISQAGANNGASVYQSGPVDYSGVYQGGAGNQALVNQGSVLVQPLGFLVNGSYSTAGDLIYAPAEDDDRGRLVEAVATPLTDTEDFVTGTCRAAPHGQSRDGFDNGSLHACEDPVSAKARALALQVDNDRPFSGQRAIEVIEIDYDAPAPATPTAH